MGYSFNCGSYKNNNNNNNVDFDDGQMCGVLDWIYLAREIIVWKFLLNM
jgi:hypothetical protein